MTAMLPIPAPGFLAQTEAPTTPAEVKISLQETLLKTWSDMVDHLPFLGMAVVVLAVTSRSSLAGSVNQKRADD